MNERQDKSNAAPAHFAYGSPDGAVLRQGDILRRSAPLLKVVSKWHPYFAQDQYKYFQILTQSCNLERDRNRTPVSHITIAVVRSIDDAISREAQRYQDWWMSGLGCIDAPNHKLLFQLVGRIIDNSEPGYFFLPEELALDIAEDNCAFLRLSIALKAEHYDTCLDAKIAELSGEFRAKLGWNVGTLFSQVGTPGWDDEYGHGSRDKLASKLIKSVLTVHSEEKIRLALGNLLTNGKEIKDFHLADIKQALESARPKKPKTRFIDSAKSSLESPGFFRQLLKPFAKACRRNVTENTELNDHLVRAGIESEEEDQLALRISTIWSYWLGQVCTDEMPESEKMIEYIAQTLAADPAMARYIKG